MSNILKSYYFDIRHIKLIFLHKKMLISVGLDMTVLNYLSTKYNSLKYESKIH